VETHVERLAEQFADLGHRVEVLTQHWDRSQPDVEDRDGVRIRRFRQVRTSEHYSLSPGLWRFLRQADGYDLVHAHNYHALPALMAALASRLPLVFTPHYHGTAASRLRRALHRPYRRGGARLAANASSIICVSSLEAHLFTRDFPEAADRIDVIPNGVEMDALMAAEPFPEDRIVVLSAGRLEPYKNVERTVEALAHLDEDFLLRITGDGRARPALQRRIDELELAARARLLGQIDVMELRRWFRTARVYVTMSRIEAMPITPLEVLAAGARVVASDIDAHRNIAELTGGPVTLVDPDIGPEPLARAIEHAAAGDASTADVRSWAEVATTTLAIYERVAAKRPIIADRD
jgi:glycosyltransferase involved in cell wall biosynthesis